MTAISALSGVQWTELNGANLDAQAELDHKVFVEGLTSVQKLMGNVVKDFPVGNYSFNDVMSPLYSMLNGVYLTEGEALAKLGDIKDRGVGLYQIHKMRYVDNTGAIRWAYLDDEDGGRQIHKGLVNEPFNWQDPSVITYRPSNQGLTTGILDKVYAEINSQMSTPLNPNEMLAKSQWVVILDKLKQATFSEASKLKIANGGGLKTFGGKWFINGETLSYLDIFFAVRVNQLYVVNNSITDYLGQLQKNNTKIKSANALSNIITTNTPTNSSNSVAVGVFIDDFIKEGVNSGLLKMQWAGNPISQAQMITNVRNTYTALPAVNKKATAFIFVDSADNKTKWLLLQPSGSYTIQDYSASNNEKTMVNSNYAINNMCWNFSGLQAMMPTTCSKLFNQWGYINGLSTGLTQSDCNSITTEFKAYTSAIDSQSQLLQTQLTQFNDKRSEVLDDMSSIVKGNTSVMVDVARNSGAV